MKTLTFQVSDELYEAFRQTAMKHGRMTEDVALDWLAKHAHKPFPALTAEERRRAWERLRRHAGAAQSGDSRSADNDRLEAE